MEALVASKRAQAAADKVQRFKMTGGKESNSHEMPVLLSHGTLLKNSERRPISWIIDGKKVPLDSNLEKNILTERFTKKISNTGTFAALLEKNRLLQQTQKSPDGSPGTVRKSIIVIKRKGETAPGGDESPSVSHIVSKFHQSGASVNVVPSTTPHTPIVPQTIPLHQFSASNEVSSLNQKPQTQVSISPTGQKIITVMSPQPRPQTPSANKPVQIIKAGSSNDIKVVDGQLVIGGRLTGIPIAGGTKIVYQGSKTPESARKLTVSSTGNIKLPSPAINIGSMGLTTTQTVVKNQGEMSTSPVNANLLSVGSRVDTIYTQSSEHSVENKLDISVNSGGTLGVEAKDLSNTLLQIQHKTNPNTAPSLGNTTELVNYSTSSGEQMTNSHVAPKDQMNSSVAKKIVTLTVNSRGQITSEAKPVHFPILKPEQNGGDIHKLNSYSGTNQIQNSAKELDRKRLSNVRQIPDNTVSVFDRIVDLPTCVEAINQNEVEKTVIKDNKSPVMKDNNKSVCDKMDISEGDIHSNRKRKNIFESFDSETAPIPPTKSPRLSLDTISPEQPQVSVSKTSPGENNIRTCPWSMEKFMKPTDILNSLTTKLANRLSPSKINEYKYDSAGSTVSLSANCNNNVHTEDGVESSVTVNSSFTESQAIPVFTVSNRVVHLSFTLLV